MFFCRMCWSFTIARLRLFLTTPLITNFDFVMIEDAFGRFWGVPLDDFFGACCDMFGRFLGGIAKGF